MRDAEHRIDQIASQLRAIGQIEPSAAAVARIRLALLRPAAAPKAGGGLIPRFGTWRRPAYALAFAVALLTLASTSVFAAGDALPDSPLYVVRNARENVEVTLAGSPAERAFLYASFAAQRSAQLHDLVRHRDSTRAEVVSTLLRDISDRVHHANQEAHNDGQGARADVNQVDRQIGQQLTELQQGQDLTVAERSALTQTVQDVQSAQSGNPGTDNAANSENGNQP